MREGALDAYAVVLVRMRWTPDVNMRSRIVWQANTYQIIPETFHADKQANTIQFMAQLVINDSMLPPPVSNSDLTGEVQTRSI